MLRLPHGLSARIVKVGVRLGVALLILSSVWWGTSSTYDATGFSGRLNRVIRDDSFGFVDWELRAMADGLFGTRASTVVTSSSELPPYDSPEAVAIVREYFALGQELRQLHGELNRVWASRDSPDRTIHIAALRQEIDALVQEREAMEWAVERIISEQVARELELEGFSRSIFRLTWRPGIPPIALDVTPPVWFEMTPLPQVLVIAPRSAVTIKASHLIRSDLDIAESEDLEERVDQLGVSSIVTPIGGFAAYPAMVPNNEGLAATLTTVAHEWVHHYFFVRPLGMRYFSSYRMRSINETAADIAGEELGRKVYERYYRASEPSVQQLVASDRPGDRPSFLELIRSARQEVEQLLEKGDIAGAERHMEEQKAVLAQYGYYVRKLNTAYLSLFGSYAGTGNPDEPKLHLLRQRTGSLKAFLDTVAAIDSAETFDRLVEQEDGGTN